MKQKKNPRFRFSGSIDMEIIRRLSLSVALITPVVTDCPYPSAFPIAMAGSPTFNFVESTSAK